MTRRKIWSVVPLVLGALLLIPFFVWFWRVTTTYGSVRSYENVKLFSKAVTDADVKNYLKGIDRSWGYPFYMIAKISAVAAIVGGLIIAVMEILRLIGFELGCITRIIAVAEIVVGTITLVAGIIFFIAASKTEGSAKICIMGHIGYYFTVIGSLACGITAMLGKKE